MQIESRPVEIRSDSQYVVDGVHLHLDRRRRQGWLEIDNGDLWAALDDLLRGRDASSVHFVKVKGHAKVADVRAGRVDRVDKEGNDAADILARRGAALQEVGDGYKARMQSSKRLAEAVQRLMSDIIVARNSMASATGVTDEEVAVVEVEEDSSDAEGDVWSISSASGGGEGGVVEVNSSEEERDEFDLED